MRKPFKLLLNFSKLVKLKVIGSNKGNATFQIFLGRLVSNFIYLTIDKYFGITWETRALIDSTCTGDIYLCVWKCVKKADLASNSRKSFLSALFDLYLRK